MASDTDTNTARNWWAGPWKCSDCPLVFHNYADAEEHRRRGHTLTHKSE